MRKPQPDLIAFSFLLFSCALIAWTGVAGPIFSDGLWKGLENWQTIIAALLALAAAYLAARPVYRQLAEQRRQSAAAAVSMIVKAAVSLEAERDVIRKAIDDLRVDRLLYEYDAISWLQIYASWPEEAFEFMKACDAALRSLRLFSERNPDPSPTQYSRLAAIASLAKLKGGLSDLVTIMRQETTGLAYEEGEQDIPDDEHPTKRSQMDVDQESWITAARKLDEDISVEIAAIWRRIRQLESIAIGASQ